MGGDRKRFNEYVGKFQDCYQSIEVRIICGKKGDEWRNIWTHIEFRPEYPQKFRPEPHLPNTDYVRAIHQALPLEDAGKTIEAIVTGGLSIGNTEVLYLSDSPDEKPGLRLSGSYRLRNGASPAWSYAFLSGSGPYALNKYTDKEGPELDLHLIGLRPSLGDLGRLVNSFGRRNLESFDRTGVHICAPLMLRFGECRCEDNELIVRVEGVPSFAALFAHINVLECGADGEAHPEVRDLRKEAWEEKGSLLVNSETFRLRDGRDVTVTLSAKNQPADEFRVVDAEHAEQEQSEPQLLGARVIPELAGSVSRGDADMERARPDDVQGGDGSHLPSAPPSSLEEALDRLLHEVDKHRLEFLYFADVLRINPLLARTGAQETIRKSGLAGWEHMMENIDSKGEFLFRYRNVLERFAQEAISQFGSGPGIPPKMMAFEDGRMKRVDVERGSLPHWSIDEVGCPYLEESADCILRTCASVCSLDPSGRCRALVEQATSIAHDKDQPRWYPSILVRWEYLSKLDEAIASIKMARVKIPSPDSREEEKRPTPSPPEKRPAEASAYVIDCEKMGLFCCDSPVPLSPLAWGLLHVLAYERGRIVPSDQVIVGEEAARPARARDGRRELGRCLGSEVAKALVITEKGRGYRLKVGPDGVKVKGQGEVGLVQGHRGE